MECKFDKFARINAPRNPRGFKIIDLGQVTYSNDLDHCFLWDYLEDEIDRRAEKEKKEYKGPHEVYGIIGGEIIKAEMESILESIYKIQGTPQTSKEFAEIVNKEFPFVTERGWDITSPDFLKELWFTGEFLEKNLGPSIDSICSVRPLARSFRTRH